MAKTNNSNKPQETPTKTAKQRRALLKKLGRFAAVTAPTVTLLLAAQTKPGGAAVSCGTISSRALKITDGPVNVAAVLAGVTALPIRVWRE
jgi:hypothetical protein